MDQISAPKSAHPLLKGRASAYDVLANLKRYASEPMVQATLHSPDGTLTAPEARSFEIAGAPQTSADLPVSSDDAHVPAQVTVVAKKNINTGIDRGENDSLPRTFTTSYTSNKAHSSTNMSAVAPPPASTPEAHNSPSWEHTDEIKEYLQKIHLNVAPLTTYAAFEYLTVHGSNVAGALVLQVGGSDGNHFAILPLATGDATSVLGNTGFSFVESQDWTKLDSKVVTFTIASSQSPANCVISFSSNGLIATFNLTNGQLCWLGATGYCTFFKNPGVPQDKPKA